MQEYQAHQQLMATIQGCQAEINRQVETFRRLAPQGIIVPPAQCSGNMPQWIAQLRYIEAQIGHCQGDPRPLCEQQGYPAGCQGYRPG